jgi:hypothetical protein
MEDLRFGYVIAGIGVGVISVASIAAGIVIPGVLAALGLAVAVSVAMIPPRRSSQAGQRREYTKRWGARPVGVVAMDVRPSITAEDHAQSMLGAPLHVWVSSQVSHMFAPALRAREEEMADWAAARGASCAPATASVFNGDQALSLMRSIGTPWETRNVVLLDTGEVACDLMRYEYHQGISMRHSTLVVAKATSEHSCWVRFKSTQRSPTFDGEDAAAVRSTLDASLTGELATLAPGVLIFDGHQVAWWAERWLAPSELDAARGLLSRLVR